MKGLRTCTRGAVGTATLAALGIMFALIVGAYATKEGAKPKIPSGKETAGMPASRASLARGGGGGVAGCPASSCAGGFCTLTQSLDTVTIGSQVACGILDPPQTTANGWARCYNLTDEGVPGGGPLTIDSVTFGVSQATVDGINVDVILYLDMDDCPPVAPGVDALELCRKSIVVNMADVDTMITVDFPEGPTVPMGRHLIVEVVNVDDGTVEPIFAFRTTANAGGQCGPSYIRTPEGDCDLAGWTDLADIGFPDTHFVQIVNATVGGIGLCGNGRIEGCEECDPPDGTTCGDDCQLLPTGACCNSDGAGGCEVMSAPSCALTGTGFYLGDDTACVDCPPVACGPGTGPCDQPNGSPGCEDVECCAAVCNIFSSCCTIEWDETCVEIATDLVQCQADPSPIMIATGPDSNVDGYLDVSPDVYGSYESASFGGLADHYNPVGAHALSEAAFTSGLYVFVGGTQRELLSSSSNWQGVFGPDASLTLLATAPNVASDTNGDTVADTLTSEFRVFGGSTDLTFGVTQHVERIIPLGGNPVAILTQTYLITNNSGSAINFELVSAFDGDLLWDPLQDYTDDSVGTGTNGSPELDRFVFEQEEADPTTAITISSAGGGAYAGSKGGINPDPGDPTCVPYGYGTDTQIWDDYGIPTCWRNNIAGVGYDTDGESGNMQADPDCSPCDGSAFLEIPVSLGAGASTTITVTHTYGANTPGGAGGPPCPWDLSGNGNVGPEDLATLLTNWGPCPPPCPPDFNGNGDVGPEDLATLLTNWGACP